MNVKLKWVLVICIVGTIGIIVWLTTHSEDTLKQQILEMQGQHINLNFKHARCIINGTDSLLVNNSKPKLIVFVDSTSCSSCFLGQLPKYEGINDTLNHHNGEMIVVLHPQKARIPEIESRLNYEKYPFWCILDKKGEFPLLNPDIPNNSLLHTFTINAHGNIILVGDPTRNTKIKDLLFEEVIK